MAVDLQAGGENDVELGAGVAREPNVCPGDRGELLDRVATLGEGGAVTVGEVVRSVQGDRQEKGLAVGEVPEGGTGADTGATGSGGDGEVRDSDLTDDLSGSPD